MEFKPLDRMHQETLAPYFAAQRLHLADFSLGYQFMWYDALKPEYAVVAGCLVLREYFSGNCYYHFPLSLRGDPAEEDAALSEIEAFCRNAGVRLHFTNIPRDRLTFVLARYGEANVSNSRRWRDYLYAADDFRNYPGKKYAGQRNHAAKFRRLYPDYTFTPLAAETGEDVDVFLREYAAGQCAKGTLLARREMQEVYEILPRLGALGLFGGALRAEGRVVGLSVGERCGDMVVVHIEKALRDHEGAYPVLAQEFARMFAGDARYMNRMDDAGDMGLRKSKLQYHPLEVVDKFTVIPKRAIDRVSALPEVRTPRLVLRPVADADAAAYARLASDPVRNRYWGYDWRADLPAGAQTPGDVWFLAGAREDFRHRREMPLGIYAEGRLIGEAVLHNFGYRAEAEIGVRLFADCEGQGYAREAVEALTGYAFARLDLERVEAKCYRENARSRAMLSAAGMRPCGEDGTFYYFVRTPAM